MTSTLKEDLLAGPVLASFIGIGHPAVAEIMAWRGFRVLCIDAEHSSLGPAEVEQLVRAANAAGASALVRVPELGPGVGHALDAGAAGIVVPRVESAAQARSAAAAVRYPPTGVRGAGVGRAAKYGQDLAGLLDRANDQVLLVAQVETRGGVAAAAAIAAEPGVDVVFVGPGDLAVSLGCEMWSEPHLASIDTVVTAGLQAGKQVGMFCPTPDRVAHWVERGVRLVFLSSDAALLGSAAGAAATAALETIARSESGWQSA